MLTGLLRDLLTRHFAGQTTIEEPVLRRQIWQESKLTGILIESIYRWRKELVEKRPAVIIKLNGRRNVRRGINDAAGSDEQGRSLYRTFWVGSHTLFCIHGSGASAEILATEVQTELTRFHPVITSELNLGNWQVVEVGGVSVLAEARDAFVVPVTVGWCYQQEWRLNPETPKLRSVPITLLLDGAGS